MIPAWLVQRFLYYPVPFLVGTPADVDLVYEDILLTTADGAQIHGWFLPRQDAVGTLYFLHGNAGNISHRLQMLFHLHQAGFQILILDYRGYGRSRGRPTEQGTYQDALTGWQWLREHTERGAAPLILYGRSLGGAVAAWLATQEDVEPDGVILESTFTRLRDMAQVVIPVPGLGRFVPDMYPTLDRIRSISVPLLHIHGDRDRVIPVAHGHALFEQAPEPKSLYLIPRAGHNDTIFVGGETYQQRLRRFVLEEIQCGQPHP